MIAFAARRPELRYHAPMGRAIVEFSAPWGRSLRLVTTVAVVLLLSLVLAGLLFGPRQLLLWRMAMIGAPLAVLVGALPFMVRGYLLTETRIEVRRLGWNTVLPLAGLAAVNGEPQGLRGSVRLFGNGGLFAISGWFWNRRIGRFRAYATDPERAVLLRYRDGQKVIVTPHDVQHFVIRARNLAGLP
ncbi:MAG TPA: PH domain-containing protein [Steroidobacteraceae bacterium]